MIKQDILEYLNTLRKSHIEDPTQKWIGSYNGRQMILNKFFKWVYNPDEPDHKERETPACMQGVKNYLKRTILLTNLMIFGNHETMLSF